VERFKDAVGLVVAGTTETRLPGVLRSCQHSAANLLEEITELLRLFPPQSLDSRRQTGRFEGLVLSNQFPAGLAHPEQNDPTIVIRGLAVNEAEPLELVEVLARRRRRDAERTGQLADLEIRLGCYQLEKAELRPGEVVRPYLVQKILFEKLSQQRPEDVTRAEKAIEILTRNDPTRGRIVTIQAFVANRHISRGEIFPP
jgi:hypothetical protein